MKTRTGISFVTVILAGAALLAGFAAGRSIDDRKHYPGTNPDLPFSAAVQAGDTLYLAGTIGLTPGTREVPDDPKQEARNALDTIKARLEAAGMTMDDLVVVQVFCSDVKFYDDFNEVYKTYFEKDFPARAFIGSGTLLFSARFEVQGTAVRR
jgi:reactive intermediate/imine deaminase